MAAEVSKYLSLIDNYIYLYHLDTYVVIPTYPDTIMDSMTSTFKSQSALSRSAPIFSYSDSGPRTVRISLDLHRDMLNNVNYQKSNLKVELGDDYVDTLIKQLQSIAVPKYVASAKSVLPPMVAVRFGNEIFIKGIVTGSIDITYTKPILDNNKYALVTVGFTVSEIDPYDAESIKEQGSFRGMTRTFKSGIYKEE